MKRPPTERERLLVRINQAAYEALYRHILPDEIRGFSVHPCPGNKTVWPTEPCAARGAHVGSYGCGVVHTYSHTNHAQKCGIR